MDLSLLYSKFLNIYDFNKNYHKIIYEIYSLYKMKTGYVAEANHRNKKKYISKNEDYL